jgi:hypothetical protein
MHHRALGAVVLTARLGAATLLVDPARPPPARARVAVPPVRHVPTPVGPGALREVAAIMAGQAVALRSAVRRCGARRSRARGTCVLMALGHAEAGATLTGLVLRATMARLPAGPCVALARRLSSVAATVAAVASEGVHSRTWPGVTWAAAQAAARVGARVVAVRDGRWPRTCLPALGGLRA